MSSICQQTVGTQDMNCGRIVHSPSTTRRTRVATSTWAINASLPSGVSFGTNNGTIYGTPTELWTQTSYMVWANNSGGSSVAYLNITVNDEAPVISYSTTDITGTIDVALVHTSDQPRVVAPSPRGRYLPSRLCVPLQLKQRLHQRNTEHPPDSNPIHDLGQQSGGSSVAYVNVTINDVAPGPFEYNPENNTWTNNTEVHLAPQFINQPPETVRRGRLLTSTAVRLPVSLEGT